jgi:hypothetical protein
MERFDNIPVISSFFPLKNPLICDMARISIENLAELSHAMVFVPVFVLGGCAFLGSARLCPIW